MLIILMLKPLYWRSSESYIFLSSAIIGILQVTLGLCLILYLSTRKLLDLEVIENVKAHEELKLEMLLSPFSNNGA